MRWNWYVRRVASAPTHTDELYIDLDGSPSHGKGLVLGSDGKPVPPKPVLARGCLLGAVKDGLLAIDGAWVYPSRTRNHWHMAVKLSRPMPFGLAVLWSARLCDDGYRNKQNAMRVRRGVVDSLLITPVDWKGFYREPDYVCHCLGKHTHAVMAKCPVALLLRGNEAATDYFGNRVIDNSPLTFGRIL